MSARLVLIAAVVVLWLSTVGALAITNDRW
jgi:hypothetical protein